MPARRETRSEMEAFQARLAGRSAAERQRLAAEHRAFIDGEKDDDADFGDAEPAQVTVAVTPTPAPTSRPHTGKSAVYIQMLKDRMAARLADEAAEKAAQAKKAKPVKTAKKAPAKGEGKMTKKRMAEIARKEKKAKEARAVARAEAASLQHSAEKKKQRDRIAQEEREGRDARQRALADLKKKRAEDASRKQTASSGYKKQKKTSPHVQDADDEADDESLQENSGASPCESAQGSTSPTGPASPVDKSLQSTPARQVSRTLSMDSTKSATANTASQAEEGPPCPDEASDGGFDSDLDGDGADSEDWYFETDLVAESEAELELRESANAETVASAAEAALSDSDDALDGVALLARQRARERRELARNRLRAAKATLTRDLDTTTANWDELTKEEMGVLAQDTEALQKMRADG
ncbi:hypothetical protein PF002_g22769 [Phytophthora fragariae]|uniref:Uncharacterized protein n=1 Tax=Phytophthora fragariae TaxID=53985 RepID=A0A6A3X8L9_9STRA|nr:hypothetical protein PF002_g22769 [Phytophthora fragariae]